MTRTDSEVQRVTRGSYCVLYASGRKSRQIVVRIGSGDVLEFRELGRSARFIIPIDSAFKFAVRCKALSDAAEKARLNPRKKKSRR